MNDTVTDVLLRRSVSLASVPNADSGQNPYLRLLYARQAQGELKLSHCPGVRFGWICRSSRDLDVLHIHWPSFYYASPRVFARWKRLAIVMAFLAFARCLGVKVVWTLHNIYPHERMPGCIDHVARWLLVRLVDRVIAHDREAIEEAERRFGKKLRYSIVPMMSYLGVYPTTCTRAEARRALGIADDAFVYLHFGSIRPNKRVPDIIRAFRSVARDGDLLLVPGRPICDEADAALREAAGEDESVRLRLDDVPDDEVQMVHAVSDVGVVAGEITNSSSLFLYLTFGLPVVAPSGTFPAELRGEPCCIEFDGQPSSLADALKRARELDAVSERDAAAAIAEQRHPDRIAAQFAQVMRGICFGNDDQ